LNGKIEEKGSEMKNKLRIAMTIVTVMCSFTTPLLALAEENIDTTNEEVTSDARDSEIEAAPDWKNINGNWYYMNVYGDKKTGWINDQGTWYHLNTDGVMETDWISNMWGWYYLSGSGAMTTGWQKDNENWYYLDNDGKMQTGWIQVDGDWYYLSGNGSMATGWFFDGSSWYYLTESGRMATGWIRQGADWYYLTQSGSMATGWLKDGETWYYLTGSGAMATGWINLNGTSYYLESNGSWNENPDSSCVNASESDIMLLAAIVQLEAGGEIYEGQLAVANVVLNRVNSGKFPNTISEVIYQRGQFTPAGNGSLDRLRASGNIYESCVQAAREALSGNNNVPGYLYFSGNRGGMRIGNHRFSM
jgi:hypothetical protein